MDKRTYTVAMIGIPEHERNVLTNIFKLSLYRPRSYAVANGGFEKPAEILMVDADDPKAMAEWLTLGVSGTGRTKPTFSGNSPAKPVIPTVMITKVKLANTPANYIRRPFVATRVLSVLDQMPVEKVISVQERIIGEQPKPLLQATPIPQFKPEVQSKPELQSKPVENLNQARQLYKALVVDDSLAVRKQIELELKLFGIQVEAVETGEKALELLTHKSFDLIFLDVILPGIDGYQICKAIKKNKVIRKTPVIMLTGKSSPFDRVKGALSGCDTYLTKPVKQASFHKVLKKYMN